MGIVIIFFIGCLSGFILFRKNTVSTSNEPFKTKDRLSVIIPARNEEMNLPYILRSLKKQTYQAFEIIVVDDGSEDQTKEIAEGFGVKVIEIPELPPGWTGKTWAVWNGYLYSSGEILAFLDADIRLGPCAFESLLNERDACGGVISVVPFHEAKKFYERFALIPNILGVFAFTSPFEKQNKKKGLYGSCIITTRSDYEKVNGHQSIKNEILDDLNLGAQFTKAGIKVNNYTGGQMVAFRMYPQGIKSELQGFAKGTISSPSSLNFRTLFFVILWIVGLIISDSFALFINTSLFTPLFIGYILYTIQIYYFIKLVGNFGKLLPLVHFLSTIFFLVVVFYSLYQIVFLKRVVWKGRNIDVGRKENL